jgi:hypothetical protein
VRWEWGVYAGAEGGWMDSSDSVQRVLNSQKDVGDMLNHPTGY